MTRYKALTDFAGEVSMGEGEECELSETAAADLVRAGYIAPVKDGKEVTGSESIGNNTHRRKKAAENRL